MALCAHQRYHVNSRLGRGVHAQASSAPVIGCVFGLQFLALPCGFAAAKLMQWYAAGHIGAELLPYVGFAAVTVLVVAYVFVLPSAPCSLLSPRLLKLSHESLDDRCRGMAAAFGLTEREYRYSCCWPVAAT